ncbi:Per1-like protein [Xylariaceae sp. FL0594]|nr:Per1-like protein [Xylariaceae sp. FL0594]
MPQKPRTRRMTRTPRTTRLLLFFLVGVCSLAIGTAEASLGDRLPEFKECVQVCERENCDPNNDPTPIPLHLRLLLWSCAQECDYTCQHIITSRRLSSSPPRPVTQFHGKWPFVRFLGLQEPFSVLFSLGNLVVHYIGLRKIRERLPVLSNEAKDREQQQQWPMRRFYICFAYIGIATWVLSTVFHARDFKLTERLDYFGAGASVLYGLYYTVVRVFRLDDTPTSSPPLSFQPTQRRRTRQKQSLLRIWTLLCASLYAAHVAYLTLWKWDYGYNMRANLVVGALHNALWTALSWRRWRETRQAWTTWPGVFVAWVTLAMSLELLDFPPLWGAIDAHSLWHAGTIAPTVLWYNFMIRDSQDLARSAKLKESKA